MSEIINSIEKHTGVKFSDEQKSVIKHEGTPSCVIACAGSGKTTTMIGSVIYKQKEIGVQAKKIMVISFNKSAVEEISSRYKKVADELEVGKAVNFKTFHAFYYAMLKKFYASEYDQEVRIVEDSLAQYWFNRAFYSVSRDKNNKTLDEMKSLRAYQINNCLSTHALASSPKFNLSGVDISDYVNVNSRYDTKKIEEADYGVKLCDFDDLQVCMLQLLVDHPEIADKISKAWDYWYIDEYQDISKIQFEILKKCVRDSNKLMVIGDDDQTIYEFRGSSVDFILDFGMHFDDTKRFMLSENFRCPAVVLDRAKVSIAQNSRRFQKSMVSNVQGGEILYRGFASDIGCVNYIIDDVKEKFDNDVNPKDMSILMRNNVQQIMIVDRLIDKGIPFKSNSRMNIYDNPIFVDFMNTMEFSNRQDNYNLADKVMTKFSHISKNEAKRVIEDMKKTGSSFIEIADQYFYKGNELADLLEYMSGIINEKDTIEGAFSRFVMMYSNYLQWMISVNRMTENEANDIITYISAYKTNMTFRELLIKKDKAKSIMELNSKSSNVLTVSTMHSMKGLEFKHVYILSANDSIIPATKRLKHLAMIFGEQAAMRVEEQERRLFYVACTRAKETLHVTYRDDDMSKFVYEQVGR